MSNLQQKIIEEGRLEETDVLETRLTQILAENQHQEEILWRQKSRINWLKEGERNTKIVPQIYHLAPYAQTNFCSKGK